jgi:nitrite reductase/ring-hydroxylating ferredoxin subunit
MAETDEAAWAGVLSIDALEDQRPARVKVDGVDVLVVRDGERLFAIANRCTHQGAPLDKGRATFSGSITSVTCPVHGSTFDLATGTVLRGPATQPEPAYDARVVEGTLEIRRRD